MNLLLANITPQTVDIVAIVFVLIFAISGLIKGFTKIFFKGQDNKYFTYCGSHNLGRNNATLSTLKLSSCQTML